MTSSEGQQTAVAKLHVGPAPHIFHGALTTRAMMRDVLIALLPIVAVALWQFRLYTVIQLALGVGSALIAEVLFQRLRGRRGTWLDGSAAVTGAILALSLPAAAPWYVGVVGGFVAIGLGKVVFGGLGHNIFNPAMVGRAFALMAFPQAMGASAYVVPEVDGLTQATPLTALKMWGQSTGLLPLLTGATNGSIGETSALACLLGGAYLCARRTASYEIPVAAILALGILSALGSRLGQVSGWTPLHELCSGAFLFGAFYIATDPVTSPLTPAGKWWFGAGFGALVFLIRKMSGYPEGVMFAVLVMNGLVPLLNRMTIPVPVGGPVPQKSQGGRP